MGQEAPVTQEKEKEVNKGKHPRKNTQGTEPDKTQSNLPHKEPPLEQQQQGGKDAEAQREPKHKKQKANKKANTFCMDDEEFAGLIEALQEDAKTSLNYLGKWQTKFTTHITERLNELGKAIRQVKIIVDHTPQVPESQDELGPSEVLETQRPKPNHPVRVQIIGEVLYLGTPQSNEVTKSVGQVFLHFSHMRMEELYALQKAAIA